MLVEFHKGYLLASRKTGLMHRVSNISSFKIFYVQMVFLLNIFKHLTFDNQKILEYIIFVKFVRYILQLTIK